MKVMYFDEMSSEALVQAINRFLENVQFKFAAHGETSSQSATGRIHTHHHAFVYYEQKEPKPAAHQVE